MRFTEDENRRLHEAVERDGKRTVQGFLHDAALMAIVESERKGQEIDESRMRQQKTETRSRLDPTRGLGIRSALLADLAPEPAPAPAPAPPPQVVIALAPGAAAQADADLDNLAAYVINGDRWSRGGRLATAKEIVAKTSAPDARERKLKTLEEKVAALDKASPKPKSLLDTFLGS